MNNHQLVVTMAVALLTAPVFGQRLPASLPSRQFASTLAPQLEAWSFVLHGKTYSAMLSRAHMSGSPEWTPSNSLPMSPAKAEEIARVELRKLVSDDSTWVVEEFGLRRFRGEAQAKWLYVVKLKSPDWTPNGTHDRFVLPISLSGEPGKVTPQQ